MLDYGKPVRIQRKSWKSLKSLSFFLVIFFLLNIKIQYKKRGGLDALSIDSNRFQLTSYFLMQLLYFLCFRTKIFVYYEV